MKHIYILVSILILMTACAEKKPEEKKVIVERVSIAPEILLFKQSLPIKQEVLNKAYKKISPRIGLSNMSDLKGQSFNGEFIFNEDKIPFVEYKFDKPYIIKKVHLKGSGFVVNGNASSSNIKKFELLFLDGKKTPSYIGELKANQQDLASFDNVQADGVILKTRSVYVPDGMKIHENDVVAGFDARIEVEVIDADYIYDIVAPVLSERESSASNEDLLKTIALMNTELFKRLKENQKNFNLPKTSVLYLPADADMHYAVAHTKSIYETGKYKTIDGQYKIHIFSEEAEFDAKGNVKVQQHKIEIKNSNRNLKTTQELPDHEKFIDFSEGIK